MTPVEAPVPRALATLANGRNADPFALLGPHPDESGRGILVRAFHPAARSIELRRTATGALLPMTRRVAAGVGGVYEVLVPFEASRAGGPPDSRDPGALDYRLRLTFAGDHVIEIDDPYRYGRVLTDFDLHLFGEG